MVERWNIGYEKRMVSYFTSDSCRMYLNISHTAKASIALKLHCVPNIPITINGSCASRREYPACLDMIAAGTVKVDSLITAVSPFAEGDSWFRRLYQKEKGLVKVILEP